MMSIETKLKRSAIFGIGKQMTDAVYVHSSYEHVLPQALLQKAKKLLPKDFRYNIVKLKPSERKLTFIFSPDFDKAHEPIVGPYIVIHPDGTVKEFLKKRNESLIYHHKWLMVADDYRGFSVAKSKKRSEDTYHLNVNKCKIGYKTYWENVLRRNNLPIK